MMRRFLGVLMAVLVLVGITTAVAYAAKSSCTTIQDGTLVTSVGDIIRPGYDMWGYNYQAHEFNGLYCNAYRDAPWCQPYRDVRLVMKWNDAWLANKDCDSDGLLDRHYGYPAYTDSGAWTTNHMSGEYEQDGKVCRWEDFVKIVAVPSGATLSGGVWTGPDGKVIGSTIWGEFAVVQEIYNDPCGGAKGLLIKGARPGLGNWESPLTVE